MQISVNIPDEIGENMFREGHEPARELLELSVVAALREGRIFESQAVVLLSLKSRFELWDWLKDRDPDSSYYTAASIDADLATMAEYTKKRVGAQQA